MASSSKTSRRTRPKRNAAKPPSRTTRRTSAARSPRKSAALPGWTDLATGKAVKKNGAKRSAGRADAKPGLVEGVPTLRFAVLLVAVCALFTLYVGHVYATQSLVAEVQRMQEDELRLVLKRNRLRGEFDRMTSPAVILHRAADLGLEPGSNYAPTISLEPAGQP